MFFKTFAACICIFSIYGIEENPVTDSHLSFIFKEKLKESNVSNVRSNFFQGLLGAPKMNISVSLQNASGITSFLSSHQNVLSLFFSQKSYRSQKIDAGIEFDETILEESQHNPQAYADETHLKIEFSKPGIIKNQTAQGSQSSALKRIPLDGQDRHDVWVGLFGDKTESQSEPDSYSNRNKSIGLIIDYDRFISSGILSTAFGYSQSKNRIGQNGSQGHQKQIFGIFRGTAQLPLQMYLGYSLYGSVNSVDFDRNINLGIGSKIARSRFNSGTLAPHIDFGYDWHINEWFIFEPFLSNDLLLHFQPSYSERGAPGFNEYQEALNSGLYVIKPGMNLYQYFNTKSLIILFRQEAAYRRAEPLFGTENKVSIINIKDGILSHTGLRKSNLFIFEFQMFARTTGGFYSDVLYQGGWSVNTLSNSLYLKLGHFF